jgi:hypothetical protein
MLAGKNQATEQPQMNLAMAKVYLSCKNPEMPERTWDDDRRGGVAGHSDLRRLAQRAAGLERAARPGGRGSG